MIDRGNIETIKTTGEEIGLGLDKRSIKKEDKVDRIRLENEPDLYNPWNFKKTYKFFYKHFEQSIFK